MKTLFIYLTSLIMLSNTRDVYIFYNTAGSTLKDKQFTELNSDKKGLQERDIIIHTINTPEATKEAKQWNIATATPFTFLLVGKDGSEKFRATEMVTRQKLFATIDAMPMRKQEMKNNN